MNTDLSKQLFELDYMTFMDVCSNHFHDDDAWVLSDYTGYLTNRSGMDKPKKVVIFHHNDLDGYTSGAIARYAIEKAADKSYDNDLKIITYSASHNKPIDFDLNDIDDDTEVWFVDYPLTDINNEEFLNKLGDILDFRRIVYIDHHKASEVLMEENELLPNLPGIIGDYKLSGALLTWIFVSKFDDDLYNKPIPRFVKHVSDYDTFAKVHPDTDSFKYGVDADGLKNIKTPEDMLIWNLRFDASSDCVDRYISTGKVIESYAKSQGARANSMSGGDFVFKYNGNKYNVRAINGIGNSMLFGDHYNTCDFVCLYYFDHKVLKYIYSFYTSHTDKIDCSEICEQLGGGGHPGAAGFKLPINIFEHYRLDLDDVTTIDLDAAISMSKYH